MEIDYSPLNAKNPKRMESDLTDLPKLANNTIIAVILVVLLVLLTPAVAKTFGANLPRHIGDYNFTVVAIIITGVSLLFIILRNFLGKSNRTAVRLSNFAVSNGFHYEFGIDKSNQPTSIALGGVVGSDSGFTQASNIIYGKYRDFDFQIFNPYMRGFFTMMKVRLNNKYPHIVLDSRANNPFISNIGNFFSEESRIHLEGDFDKYFKVYSKAPAEDSLRILSPDMMTLMIDSGHKTDIELFEDRLHIISNYKYASEEDIKYFFTLADTLLNKLDRRRVTASGIYDYKSRVK